MTSTEGAKKTVLVVEDEELVRELFVEVIQGLGHTVLFAKNGEEGLRVFLENKDDVTIVLTDLTMPKMNGMVMAKRIKIIKDKVIIIFISGDFSSFVTELSTADVLFCKPIIKFDLLAKLLKS